MLSALGNLGTGGELDDSFRLSTVTHVSVGEATFGITPGDATIFVTLRASRDKAVSDLQNSAESIILELAADHGLACEFAVHDDFAASMNDLEAVDVACRAMEGLAYPLVTRGCRCGRRKISAPSAGRRKPPCCALAPVRGMSPCISRNMISRMI